jgi:16S rRNA (cytidine1402-2'-O)-methyltransferase
MGTLFLVATPIGNLEDMSPRAIRTLRESKLIAAEDTRHTGKLLKHFDIHTPLTSYFEHNKLRKVKAVLSALSIGDVSLVSDAGMPALNDPGYELVRAALEAGHQVIPIPGPSAPIAALVVSGLPTDAFLYLGYLPQKQNDRRKYLQNIAESPYTLIFLESPYRVEETLEDMLAVVGDRQIGVAREMTKMFEEYWRGQISAALEYFRAQPARGEFVLVVEGMRHKTRAVWDEGRLMKAIEAGLKVGEIPSQLAARLANESGWKRREVYKLIAT